MQIDFKLFVQEKHVLFKSSMCSLGKLDEKTNHINFEPNGYKGKDSCVYINLLVIYIH
jgi:hypothetical protein